MNTMNEAVEAVARIMDPALWSDDLLIASKAARPYTVEAARRDHLKDIAPIIAAARPIIMEEAAGIADGFHQRALEWAKTVRGLEDYIDETDSSRIAQAIRAAKTDGAAHD